MLGGLTLSCCGLWAYMKHQHAAVHATHLYAACAQSDGDYKLNRRTTTKQQQPQITCVWGLRNRQYSLQHKHTLAARVASAVASAQWQPHLPSVHPAAMGPNNQQNFAAAVPAVQCNRVILAVQCM